MCLEIVVGAVEITRWLVEWAVWCVDCVGLLLNVEIVE